MVKAVKTTSRPSSEMGKLSAAYARTVHSAEHYALFPPVLKKVTLISTLRGVGFFIFGTALNRRYATPYLNVEWETFTGTFTSPIQYKNVLPSSGNVDF